MGAAQHGEAIMARNLRSCQRFNAGLATTSGLLRTRGPSTASDLLINADHSGAVLGDKVNH
jgi:hypothetical protein